MVGRSLDLDVELPTFAHHPTYYAGDRLLVYYWVLSFDTGDGGGVRVLRRERGSLVVAAP